MNYWVLRITVRLSNKFGEFFVIRTLDANTFEPLDEQSFGRPQPGLWLLRIRNPHVIVAAIAWWNRRHQHLHGAIFKHAVGAALAPGLHTVHARNSAAYG